MTSTPRKPIIFLFDYVSPYAYLAWTQTSHLLDTFDLTVTPVPVLFAGLLKAHGTSGPAETPAKRRWMIENVLQTASLLGVEIDAPLYHPFNPLLPLRATALLQNDKRLNKVMDACFRGVWQERLDITDPHVLQHLLDGAGVDGESIVADATAGPAKELLHQNTSDAIAAGVFGVPTFVFEEQLFWGVGDMSIIEAILKGDVSLDRKTSQHWCNSVRCSATR